MVERRILFSTDIGPGSFSLCTVHPEHDLDRLHGWMHDPEVARFWNTALPPDELRAYLERQLAHHASTPYLGCLDGEPVSYWEVYRADLLLAGHYPARPRDMGIHMLIGPPELRGRGHGREMLRAVADGVLAAHPYATRTLLEPDVANERSVAMIRRAGFEQHGEIELPHKRATLLVREREAA